EAVQLRVVVEHREGTDEAEVSHDHDEPRGRRHAVVVRRGKAHVQPGAPLLLVDEGLADHPLHRGVGHDDVVPGLGVGARRRVTSASADSRAGVLLVTRPSTTWRSLGMKRNGAKLPARGESYSRKNASTASPVKIRSATAS